jgi:hypothetical protein
MLWLAVFGAFCAPPTIGLVVLIIQRRPDAPRGFEVIVIQPVIDEDTDRETGPTT